MFPVNLFTAYHKITFFAGCRAVDWFIFQSFSRVPLSSTWYCTFKVTWALQLKRKNTWENQSRYFKFCRSCYLFVYSSFVTIRILTSEVSEKIEVRNKYSTFTTILNLKAHHNENANELRFCCTLMKTCDKCPSLPNKYDLINTSVDAMGAHLFLATSALWGYSAFLSVHPLRSKLH